METEVVCGIIIISSILLFFIILVALLHKSHFELPEERAGRVGEHWVSNLISEVLYPEDILLTNVEIFADEKQTELDNVVINDRGVFIIEAKNYSGELIGEEDDDEWIKNKVTGGGVYLKKVRNPIKQVKRQIYILSRLFKNNGIDVWIEGYVFFVEMNSPLESPFILETQDDIDRAIHNGTDNGLSDDTIDIIVAVLTE